MALFDFLKRKKEVEKSLGRKPMGEAKKPAQKKPEKVSVKKEIRAERAPEKAQDFKVKNTKGFSYSVIKEPHISEKATNLSEKNKYVFKVYNDSNKLEIKKSVEGIYRVDVLAVNIIKIPAKKRRLGKTEGFRKGHTKAVVTIKEGQKIEIL